MDPALVLADEATGNLDTENGELVLELLRSFNRQNGTAFLVVTHDERINARWDRVIHLVDEGSRRIGGEGDPGSFTALHAGTRTHEGDLIVSGRCRSN